ncbi:DUF4124 domain-containing protein [Thalassolituus sp. UBA2009]|jgi:hypothetical protein|uniref:DUF4124 domain-containing protein n=1 Tax=Thalassolituus sp. UBA2009 TaxID=1947658 RepID=UPI00257BF7EF|nr:DUF4124 domain-containing protein [Thalassolituus sp. UBA2009]
MSIRYLIGLMLLSSLSVRADIYRWVDEQGRLQFSDRPPAEEHAETVELKPLNQYDADEAEREGRSLTEGRDYRAEEKANKARRKAQRLAREKEQQQAQKRAAQCEKARYDLRMFSAKPYGSTSLEAMQKKRRRRDALNDKIKKYCH